MQDKAIAQIGHWQLEQNKELDPVDLYIENMFPGKNYQMLLLVFEITGNNGELTCVYKGIDIEKVERLRSATASMPIEKGVLVGVILLSQQS